LPNDGLVENLVTLEPGVAPHPGFLAQDHSQTGFEVLVQLGDPPFLVVAQWLVVDVGVADKNVEFKIRHDSRPPILNQVDPTDDD